jgi:uncharacterized protein YsxB (DUF464 family)
MVKVTINRNHKNQITDFSAKGHAEYDKYGNDIVCAAVSAILQTAIFGLSEKLALDIDVNTDDGWLNCNLEGYEAQKDVSLILEVMVIGLEKTAESYPDNLKLVKGGRNNA